MITTTNVRGYPYPTALRGLAHFYDSSYGNDVTDSVTFAIGDDALTVWIDAVDRSDRVQEFGWDPERPIAPDNKPPARFSVCRLEKAACIYKASEIEPGRVLTVADDCNERHLVDGRPIFETDDPDALIAKLCELARSAT